MTSLKISVIIICIMTIQTCLQQLLQLAMINNQLVQTGIDLL